MNSSKSVKQKFKIIIDVMVLLGKALYCKLFFHLLVQNSLIYQLEWPFYPFLLVLIYNVIHFILYSFKNEFVWYVVFCRFVKKCSPHCDCNLGWVLCCEWKLLRGGLKLLLMQTFGSLIPVFCLRITQFGFFPHNTGLNILKCLSLQQFLSLQ